LGGGILTYWTLLVPHPIAGSRYPRVKGLELEGFRRQLAILTENHTVLTSDQVMLWAEGHLELPENACYLTSDDSYKDNIVFMLPELLSQGLHGAFFPPVKPVKERELLDVNRVHFILEKAEDYETLVSDLNSLCLERGVTESELLAHRDV
jgi:peptidoglycan/xylan/chitin deacetylase (PgdA/CDA1 family)